MIKFFRKIRQNLLMENKTGKYFKYAIGEIVLVVIGILIALAISNWNSNRIQTNRNKELLLKLSKELDQNIERITDLDSFKNRYKSSDSVLKILNKGITIQDLDFITNQLNYYTITLNFNTNIFEELKNTGSLYALGSDSLVSSIQNYYQLCERESFYNLEIGKTVTYRQEKCFEGYFRFQDFYLQNPEKAIEYHNWLFDNQSQEYVYFKQFISRKKIHSNMMINKLDGIIVESKNLKQLIFKEIKQL